jgi:membrane fusion protein (multidrug efflux system)
MSAISNNRIGVWAIGVLIASITLLSVSCTTNTSAAIAPAPPDISVTPVLQKDVPIYREWIGTLDGMVNAAIKAQVTGYILSQSYTEGSFVRKGQLLFEIDPRPFQASVDQAQGELARANGQLAQARAQLVQAEAQLVQSQANQGRTQLDVDRYIPLARQQAITQQDLDNATQNNLSAKAQVEASKAQVETAKAQIQAANAAVEAAKAGVEASRVNLGFTRITSPIDGIAGQALVQVGNLVSATSATITTVSTLEPIKANFTVSEQEYLDFTRRSSTEMSRLQLELILADGTAYPHRGKFMFADRQVNQNTGAILLIGVFPNPGNILRPGQYAKVRAAIAMKQGALLVPQRAVTELQGSYQVAVVDGDNKVSVGPVKVGDRVASLWIVNEGLKAGQRVVADGVQKVRPGMVVNPKLDASSAEGKGK